MDRLAAKLESVYTASGGRKINIISHSMGGLLMKCFMSLHTDVMLSLFLNHFFHLVFHLVLFSILSDSRFFSMSLTFSSPLL